LVAIYPVYFTQSSLAQVDLAAAGFTFWALAAYIEDRRWRSCSGFRSRFGEGDCDPGSAGAVCVGSARLLSSVRARISHWRQILPPAADACTSFIRCSSCALGGLVRLHYAKTGFLLGTQNTFATTWPPPSIPAHPPGVRNAALAGLRVLRSLPAHAGGVAGNAASGASGRCSCAPANSIVDAGRVSLRPARLPRF